MLRAGSTAPKNFFSTPILYSPLKLVMSSFFVPPSIFISAIPWNSTQAPALDMAKAEAMVVILVGVAGSLTTILLPRTKASAHSSVDVLRFPNSQNSGNKAKGLMRLNRLRPASWAAPMRLPWLLLEVSLHLNEHQAKDL